MTTKEACEYILGKQTVDNCIKGGISGPKIIEIACIKLVAWFSIELLECKMKEAYEKVREAQQHIETVGTMLDDSFKK